MPEAVEKYLLQVSRRLHDGIGHVVELADVAIAAVDCAQMTKA